MNCSQAEKLLAARELGLLNPAQDRKLVRHEEHCALCRKRAAALRQARLALETGTELRPPANLADRVLRNLPAKSAPARRPWLMWSPVLAGAVILLVIFAGPFVRQRPQDMSAQEVLNAYSEDAEALGFWETENGVNGNGEWDYQNYGIPEKVSQYLI